MILGVDSSSLSLTGIDTLSEGTHEHANKVANKSVFILKMLNLKKKNVRHPQNSTAESSPVLMDRKSKPQCHKYVIKPTGMSFATNFSMKC